MLEDQTDNVENCSSTMTVKGNQTGLLVLPFESYLKQHFVELCQGTEEHCFGKGVIPTYVTRCKYEYRRGDVYSQGDGGCSVRREEQKADRRLRSQSQWLSGETHVKPDRRIWLRAAII